MHLHRLSWTILVWAFFLSFFVIVTNVFAQTTSNTVTVTPLEDTTTILQNPMMGFQDHNVTRSWWPNSTDYLRSSSICLKNGVATSCGNLTWDRINPSEGVYAFSDIDLFIDNMKAQKKFMGFRVRTIIDEASGPTIPAWASAKGVTKSTGTEPFGGRSGVEIDYHKCSFLDKWDDVVQQLVTRYDNNPTVSFIDIGGYGWYGEWWSGKTVPARSYSSQIHDATDPTMQQSMDTRTRIIKMFTGGTGSGRCINDLGQEQIVSYSYQGFKNKPVIISRGDQEDVQTGVSNGTGVRYDAVGAANTNFRQTVVSTAIAQAWPTKPIMGEFANSATPRDATFLTRSLCFAREYHLSQIHNNFGDTKPTSVNLDPLFRELGYRIVLQSATLPTSVAPSSQTQFALTWVNKGTSPAYQRFPLILYFKPKGVDAVTAQVNLSATDITKILPANITASNSDYTSCPMGTPQSLTVIENVTIPALPVGTYDLYFAFVEPAYQNLIQLALTNKDSSGRYLLGQINVQNNLAAPTNTSVPPTTQPTAVVPTNTPVPQSTIAQPAAVVPTNTAVSVSDVIWVDDALPTGAVANADTDGWNWITTSFDSGTKSHQSAVKAGVHQHFFTSATTKLQANTGDSLIVSVYLDPANPPSEIMLQWNDGTGWNYRAYWGANSITFGTDGTVSRRYMGALPTTGQWIRLSVPASAVGLEGKLINGMSFTLYNGRVAWDRAGKSTIPAPTSIPSNTPAVTATSSPSQLVIWVDDALPTGAVVNGDTDGWNWITSNFDAGTKSHQSALKAGIHQHFFTSATTKLQVNKGDSLIASVYLDPANPPSEIMLQWNDGTSWNYRAYWGANSIGWGTDGTVSRRYMGALPPAGQWMRLSVPASAVGLEGHLVNGMSFTLYNGRATWDRAGKQ